jgi:hypothetical protein
MLDRVTTAWVERVAASPTGRNYQGFANILELKVQTLAMQPTNTLLAQNIGEAATAAADLLRRTESVTHDAAAIEGRQRLEALIRPMLAVGGGTTLSRASSSLPLVGIVVTVAAIGFGGYWLLRGRKKRRK